MLSNDIVFRLAVEHWDRVAERFRLGQDQLLSVHLCALEPGHLDDLLLIVVFSDHGYSRVSNGSYHHCLRSYGASPCNYVVIEWRLMQLVCSFTKTYLI